MKVRELRALLENVVDDLPVLITKDGILTELTDDDIEIITFDGGNYIGPTALVIFTDDKH